MSFPSRPIVVQTKEDQGLVSHVRLDKRQYLTADRDRVVDEGNEEAAFFFGAPGQLVSKSEADSLGASYSEEVEGDATKDVVHVEVATPNLSPGPRVEGSGKATIPVTQADRAAANDPKKRAAVSGRDRRRSEGETFIAGELEELPDQRLVGESTSGKQYAQMEPAHYTEEEKEKTGTKESAQEAEQAVKDEQAKASRAVTEKQQQRAGNKQADRPSDK